MPENRLPRVQTLAAYQRAESWRTDVARALDHPVLIWVTLGQGRFMIDCKMRGIGPNTAIFLPRNTLFSYSLFGKPQGTVVSLPNDPDAGFPHDPAVVKAVSVHQQAEMTGTIDALSRELLEVRSGQRRAIAAHTWLMSVVLERLISHAPSQRPDQSDKVLQKFSRVVSIGHRDGKSLGEFAADLNVTTTHLTRLTNTSAGKPASTLVQESVIHAACDALRGSERSIREIADQLGFTSAAYFTRAFQAHTGQSPSDFRRGAPLQ